MAFSVEHLLCAGRSPRGPGQSRGFQESNKTGGVVWQDEGGQQAAGDLHTRAWTHTMGMHVCTNTSRRRVNTGQCGQAATDTHICKIAPSASVKTRGGGGGVPVAVSHKITFLKCADFFCCLIFFFFWL